MADPARQMRWVQRVKPVLFVLLGVPFVAHLFALYAGDIIDPVEELTGESGEWAIRCLVLTLLVTPLRKITGLGALAPLRRMLGLYTFFYASCHVVVYVWLDQYFAWGEILDDILERRYIFAGFFAFVLMLPLALTSFDAAIRRIGSKRWQRLHRLVYATAIGAVVHYFWLVKADYTEPVIYAIVFGVLLGYRLLDARTRKRRRKKRSR